MVKTTDDLDHFNDYLLSKSKSKQTQQSYTRTIRQFLKLIGKGIGENITKEDLQQYTLWAIKTKKYSRNTLTPKYTAINTYLEYLELDENWIKKHKLQPPPQQTPNKTPFTRDEIKQLFETTEYDPRDHAIIKTFYYGLLRRNELINLNVEDIDFQNHKVRINNGKGNKNDTINFHPDAIQAIKSYLKVRETKDPNKKALFLNIYGRRVGSTDVTNTVKRHAIKAGITKRVYPHLFRISGITHMAQSGLNLEEIKRQSRHRDLNTLLGYIQLTDKQVKEAYLRGISFEDDSEEIEPKTQLPHQIKQSPQQLNDTADIEMKLLERLANREISEDVYSHAMLKLKQSRKSNSLTGYV